MVGPSRPLRLEAGFLTPLRVCRPAREVPLPPPDNAGRLLSQTGLGSSPFARHYSGNRVLAFFSWGYLDVSVPPVHRLALLVQTRLARSSRAGFPHSDIPGSTPASGYPRLFAAGHVLLRLLAPRHPPCALTTSTLALKSIPQRPSASTARPCSGPRGFRQNPIRA